MKIVTYIDENGFKFQSTIRDTDIDPSIGLLQSPPDVRKLDWDNLPRMLHNGLVDRKMFTIQDVQNRQAEFNQFVLSLVGKPLFRLYQED